jgi:hypothetical protein
MSATGLMTRLNSMAIPTADLRPRLDLPTIKPSPKDGFKQGSLAIPQSTRAESEMGRRFAGGAPASSDTGAAVDSPAAFLRAGEPGDPTSREIGCRPLGHPRNDRSRYYKIVS